MIIVEIIYIGFGMVSKGVLIRERILMSYDVELTFWYQDFVESTIMKYLLTEIEAVLQIYGVVEPETADLIHPVHKHVRRCTKITH